MKKDYITDADVKGFGKDAEVVGVMEASEKYKEVSGWTIGKSYCSNCKKRIHSTPNKLRCKNPTDCECKCQTHYVGKDGLLRPYGVVDNSNEIVNSDKSEKESSDEVERINQLFKDLKKN